MKGTPVLPEGSKVAVATYVYQFDLKGGAGELKKATHDLNAIIENYLLQMGHQPVDRNLTEELLKEQKLGASGAIEETEAAKIGKLSGASYILTTLVRHDGGKVRSLASRLINTETAQIVGASGMQMDEFEKDQKRYWNSVFFRPAR